MKTINNIIFDTSPIPSALTVREFTVVGEPGAQFTMTATNEDSHFYNFSEELDKNGSLKVAKAFTATPDRLDIKTINDAGVYNGDIQFPAITDDDDYYITLYAINSTVLNSNLSVNKIYTLPRIYQYKDITVTFSLSSAGSSGTYNSLPSNVTAVGTSSLIENKKTTPVTKSISWAVSLSSSQFVIARQPVASDFKFTTTKTSSTAGSSTTSVEVTDITGLSVGMGISGTGIASDSVITDITPGYLDANKSSDLEDVYIIPKAHGTLPNGFEYIKDDVGGTITIDKSSTFSAGITLTLQEAEAKIVINLTIQFLK